MPLGRLGLGLILALDVPLASLLLIVLGVPIGLWWLGLLGLIAFVALVAAGYAFSGIALGRALLDRLGYGQVTWILAAPLGVAILGLAALLPYVGGLIALIAVIFGMGSLVYPARSEHEAVMASEALVREPSELAPSAGRPQVE